MKPIQRRDPEPANVYIELVAASYTMLVPAALMSAIFLVVGTFCASEIGGAIPWIAIATGMAASLARLAAILAYRRQSAVKRIDLAAIARWETRLALTTVLFAAALALLGATTFLLSAPVPQLLATGLLFGFCSGAVARGYIRPRVCSASVMVATLPVATAAALHGGTGHWILAALFIGFLGGSLETIRYAYRLAREQIALRNELAMVARQDPLTELANRFGLREGFTEILRTHRELPMLAVHCLDLDRFKPVNDHYGHPAGDALLRQLAERIGAILRPGDLAARLGGDEFVVVQVGIGRPEEAELFARRLARAITFPYVIEGETIEIGVSLGYATSPPKTASLDGLIAAADVVLYRVKHEGGGVGCEAGRPKALGR